MRWITFFIMCCSAVFAAKLSPDKPNPSDIRIVPVRPTPEPGNVRLTLTFPKGGQVLSSGDEVLVQAQLRGYSVGTNSDFDRAKQIYNDPNGQSLLIFIDNEHPIEIYKSFVDSLDTNNLWYDWTLTTKIPYTLKEGMHVVRAFPDRSYGESLKEPGCYAAEIFYVGQRKDNPDINLNAPYLTYNEPLETLRYQSERPILLDFYLSNVRLSRDGYKVKVTINGDVIRTLTQWAPYYIFGLNKGSHTIELELIDEKNERVPGLFNQVSRKITVG